mmetsp:Transcript_10250/g.47057  ORF Transcript_10250/g.47057 Transcript_10250/m.47057 type:complete len:202 (-) Transcript_10250:9108-9713(-)
MVIKLIISSSQTQRRLTKHAPHSMCRVYGKWSNTANRTKSWVLASPVHPLSSPSNSPPSKAFAASGPTAFSSRPFRGSQLMYRTTSKRDTRSRVSASSPALGGSTRTTSYASTSKSIAPDVDPPSSPDPPAAAAIAAFPARPSSCLFFRLSIPLATDSLGECSTFALSTPFRARFSRAASHRTPLSSTAATRSKYLASATV